ncbi:MAG: hypothetical protein N2117_09135 [Anaerolineales bacterium]|nr:hypothetical protein [Anaerolineales bacterium]MCX7755394.1 hypothetical protein [Anaerolineales bacterium]MDW8278582.1 hypothetical protein [Anaerolineales bacterium]
MPTILIHILNEDPILGEVNELPAPTDQIITVKNPRRRDGKDLHYLQANVTEVIWPMARIAFIEIIPGEEEEEIIGFVREK